MVESYTKQIQQSMSVENIVYSTGVDNSKNIYFSKDIRDSESIRYSGGLYQAQDVMDVDIWGHGLAISYDSHIVGESANNIYFCLDVWGHASNMYYSLFCMNNVDNCFGCIGLKNAKYCILNKQYTKEQHEELVPRIISHMMKTGEWGEFFPVGFSHFAYNHTLNMDKYPISKTDAIAQGFTWSDYEPPFPQVDKIIPAEKLPENIEDIPDDILAWAIECEVTKKPFRIIRQELEFYRKHHLPIPRRHPDQRYKERTKVYINY